MKKHLTKLFILPLLGLMACEPMDDCPGGNCQRKQQYQNQQNQNNDDEYYSEDGRYAPYGSARRTGRRAGRRTGRRAGY